MSNEFKRPEGQACETSQAEGDRTTMARDVAIRVARFVEDYYGEQSSDPAVLDGLWLAMQMIGGPGPAAAAMRYCGVNFSAK